METDSFFAVDICILSSKTRALPISQESAQNAAGHGRSTVYYEHLCPFHGKGNHAGGYAIVESTSQEDAITEATDRLHLLARSLGKEHLETVTN